MWLPSNTLQDKEYLETNINSIFSGISFWMMIVCRSYSYCLLFSSNIKTHIRIKTLIKTNRFTDGINKKWKKKASVKTIDDDGDTEKEKHATWISFNVACNIYAFMCAFPYSFFSLSCFALDCRPWWHTSSKVEVMTGKKGFQVFFLDFFPYSTLIVSFRTEEKTRATIRKIDWINTDTLHWSWARDR